MLDDKTGTVIVWYDIRWVGLYDKSSDKLYVTK